VHLDRGITRVFDAPRDLVFQAWSDPDPVAQWLVPGGLRHAARDGHDRSRPRRRDAHDPERRALHAVRARRGGLGRGVRQARRAAPL